MAIGKLPDKGAGEEASLPPRDNGSTQGHHEALAGSGEVNGHGNGHPDTMNNTAVYTRRRPRTWTEGLTEFAKTGNPFAWGIMKFCEPRFVYAPNYVSPGDEPGKLLKPPSEYGLQGFRQSDLHLDTGEHVTEWYKPAKEGYPTIVYCHGNVGTLAARAPVLEEMTDRGFGVVIAAYPGFKGHKSRPAIEPSEAGCNATGFAMVRHLINGRHVPMENIVLFGESLGGAVVLNTAYLIQKGIPELGYEPVSPPPPVITYNTFSSLLKRAEEQIPMLPASALMRNRFESDKIIGKIEGPILLMHGKQDEFTSCKHSEELYELSGHKATLRLLDGINHGSTREGSYEKDPDKVRTVIDCAHQYLYDLGRWPGIQPPGHVQAEGNGSHADMHRRQQGDGWKR